MYNWWSHRISLKYILIANDTFFFNLAIDLQQIEEVVQAELKKRGLM